MAAALPHGVDGGGRRCRQTWAARHASRRSCRHHRRVARRPAHIYQTCSVALLLIPFAFIEHHEKSQSSADVAPPRLALLATAACYSRRGHALSLAGTDDSSVRPAPLIATATLRQFAHQKTPKVAAAACGQRTTYRGPPFASLVLPAAATRAAVRNDPGRYPGFCAGNLCSRIFCGPFPASGTGRPLGTQTVVRLAWRDK